MLLKFYYAHTTVTRHVTVNKLPFVYVAEHATWQDTSLRSGDMAFNVTQ